MKNFLKKGAIWSVLVLFLHSPFCILYCLDSPYQLGVQAEKKGDWKTAADQYAQSLRQRPDDPRVRRSLQRALLRGWKEARKADEVLGRQYVREARRRWEAARHKRKEWSARCRQGERRLKKKKYEEASDIFNSVLEESPGFAAALRGLTNVQRRGKMALKRGKFPSPRHALVLEGILAFNAAEWERAARFLGDGLAAGGVPPGLEPAHLPEYLNRSQANLERMKVKEDREMIFDRAVRSYEAGRFEEARTLFLQIVERQPDDSESRAYLKALDSLIARVDENVHQRLSQQEITDRLLKGNLFFAQGNYMESMEEFTRVLELDPFHAEAGQQLQEVKQAMQKREMYFPEVPVQDESETKFREGLRLYGNEKYTEALTAFDEAFKLNPNHRDALQAASRLRQMLESLQKTAIPVAGEGREQNGTSATEGHSD